MRKDVKQKHFSTALREASIADCIQAHLRGEVLFFALGIAVEFSGGDG